MRKVKIIASSMDADELLKDVIDIDEEQIAEEARQLNEGDGPIKEDNISATTPAPQGKEPETLIVPEKPSILLKGTKMDFKNPKVVPKDQIIDAPTKKKKKKKGDYDEDGMDIPQNIQVKTLTELGRHLRNNSFKLSVFNIKDTLIRYLELFGERKIARHVVDQDGHIFYEIHAVYIPGGTIYKFLTKVGFKPLHPTDLSEEYPKDMRYEVAMTNGILNINVFGGLQQHAPTEETVIRNLYEWEKKRYGIGLEQNFITNSKSRIPSPDDIRNNISNKDLEISKNLLLASMQSYAVQQKSLSSEFFERAMESRGIDEFMSILANQSTFERQPSYIEINDAYLLDRDDDKVTDDDRALFLDPDDNENLFKYK